MRLLGLFGVYGLEVGLAPAQQRDASCAELVSAAAAEMLQIHLMMHVKINRHDNPTPADLALLRGTLNSRFPLAPPVIGLWSKNSSIVNVVEGSHLIAGSAGARGGLDHEFGGDRLLLLNLNCQFSFPGHTDPRGLLAFVPVRVG
jgi:hypothetical protein